MNEMILKAEERKVKGRQVKILRQAGKLPAVLYGHGVKNVILNVDYKIFEKIFQQAGTSSLIDLQIDQSKPVKVLIQEVQRDPLNSNFQHVDFHQVKMTEKLTADVELKFVGEALAVKELGGILVKNISAVKIECLPENLIHEIEVDLSRLKTFADMIRVQDLPVPPGVEIKAKGEEVVANVQPPRSEEELKALEEKVEEKVEEVAEVAKKEGEAGEEPAKEDASAAALAAEKKPEKKQDKK